MKKSNVSFPYPVLGNADDVLPGLTADSTQIAISSADAEDYVFDVKLIQNDPTISRLIQEGKAEYLVEVNCQPTLFHKNIVYPTSSFRFKISRNDLLGKVNFYPVVIAKERIDNYANPNFNEDYEHAVFSLRRGDILVAFQQLEYNVSIDYNQLTAFDSFMQMRRSETTEIVSYELDCPKINVVLPSAMYDQFLVFGQDKRYEEVIHASIVLNALLYALQTVDWEEEVDKESRELWKETVLYRCRHEEAFKKYDLNNPSDYPFIAQEMLKDPFKRMFQKLEESEHDDTENE